MFGLVVKIGMVKFVTLLHRNGKVQNQHSVYTRKLCFIITDLNPAAARLYREVKISTPQDIVLRVRVWVRKKEK